MLPLLQKYQPMLKDACRKEMRQAEACLSNRQLADVAFSIKALPFLASKIASKEIPESAIAEGLAPFINGKYILSTEGYTSTAYFHMSTVEAETTALLAVGCHTITLKNNSICEMYVVGETEVLTDNGATAVVYKYDSNGKAIKTIYGQPL